MEVVAYNIKLSKPMKDFKNKLVIVRMNRTEAIMTIKSLADQLHSNNCGAGRIECYDKNGVDFSISVDDSFTN